MFSKAIMPKVAASLKMKITTKKKEVDFLTKLTERMQLIEEPKKLGNYRKMKPYNDGLSELQLEMYRAMTMKREKKEKAIKAAEEQRKL